MPLIISCATLCLIALAVQLLLCFKAKKLAVRLIPVYFFVASAIFFALMYFGAFGQWSAGMLGNGQELVAGFFLIILAIGSAGDLIAWALWLACKKLKIRARKRP